MAPVTRHARMTEFASPPQVVVASCVYAQMVLTGSTVPQVCMSTPVRVHTWSTMNRTPRGHKQLICSYADCGYFYYTCTGMLHTRVYHIPVHGRDGWEGEGVV